MNDPPEVVGHHLQKSLKTAIIEDNNLMVDCGTTVDEAYDLLQNGILVETSKGLVCMSLNDALSSSDLNLSEEDLKDVATKLILQQSVNIIASNPSRPQNSSNISNNNREKVLLKKTCSLNFDSDGFSSECSSDISATTTSSSSQSSTSATFLSLAAAPSNGNHSIQNNNNNNNKTETKFEAPKNCRTTDVNNSQLLLTKPDTIIAPTLTTTNHQKLPTLLLNTNKRRGGWPKGRKRKPELLNLPPKAPATGYNLYLNEQRKLFKDSSLLFHEITKIVGNRWSNLSLDDKRPYLAKAEEDKRRYREELKQYRQSDAYRAYLARKRRKRLQDNVMSESDMDATDEIDDEDNEELYCRTCDQWFHNLHNKREHLQGTKHTQMIAGEIKKELLDVSNGLTASAAPVKNGSPSLIQLLQKTAITASNHNGLILSRNTRTNLAGSTVMLIPPQVDSNDYNDDDVTTTAHSTTSSVSDCIVSFVSAVARREKEIQSLKTRVENAQSARIALCEELDALRLHHNKLKQTLQTLKRDEQQMEYRVSNMWQVPSWFVITRTEVVDDKDGVSSSTSSKEQQTTEEVDYGSGKVVE